MLSSCTMQSPRPASCCSSRPRPSTTPATPDSTPRWPPGTSTRRSPAPTWPSSSCAAFLRHPTFSLRDSHSGGSSIGPPRSTSLRSPGWRPSSTVGATRWSPTSAPAAHPQVPSRPSTARSNRSRAGQGASEASTTTASGCSSRPPSPGRLPPPQDSGDATVNQTPPPPHSSRRSQYGHDNRRHRRPPSGRRRVRPPVRYRISSRPVRYPCILHRPTSGGRGLNHFAQSALMRELLIGVQQPAHRCEAVGR